MTPVSLRAFLHEHRITFPVAVDRPQAHGMPVTMQTDGLTGTPSMLIIDKAGNLRADAFGRSTSSRSGHSGGCSWPIRGTRVWWCRGGR
jgi:hypothetical protein